MKTTKRILSIALALVLALVLFVPALAQENDTPPEIDRRPIITREPAPPASVRVGDVLRLSIEAELPEGDDGELRYEWFVGERTSPESREPVLEVGAFRPMADDRPVISVRVVVTNRWTDDEGRHQRASVEREMEVELRPAGFLYMVEQLLTPIVTIPLTILFLPLMWFPWVWVFPLWSVLAPAAFAVELWHHFIGLFS